MYDEILDLLAPPNRNSTKNVAWKTVVQPSLVKGANDGLFVTSNNVEQSTDKFLIRKSQVVCLYAGKYYPPPPLWVIGKEDVNDLYLKPNNYFNWTTQKSAYEICCNSHGGYLDGEDNNVAKGLEFAAGKMVNHPPKGIMPNVYPVDFSWRNLVDYCLSKEHPSLYLPLKEFFTSKINLINPIGEGIWYIDPDTSKPCYFDKQSTSCGIALVAIRDIEHTEELYMDYRFNLNIGIPSWYHPVDYRTFSMPAMQVDEEGL